MFRLSLIHISLLAALSAPDSVSFGDRSMRQRSPEQIRTALQQVDAEIAKVKAATDSTAPRSRVIRLYTEKGF